MRYSFVHIGAINDCVEGKAVSFPPLVFSRHSIISATMSRNARHISKIAATLFIALALIAVGRAPMQHQSAEASESASIEAGMPCEKMSRHMATDLADDTTDQEHSTLDPCCGGALCTGYTLDGLAGSFTPFQQPLIFEHSPPVALHVADIVLPKRPPRFL